MRADLLSLTTLEPRLSASLVRPAPSRCWFTFEVMVIISFSVCLIWFTLRDILRIIHSSLRLDPVPFWKHWFEVYMEYYMKIGYKEDIIMKKKDHSPVTWILGMSLVPIDFPTSYNLRTDITLVLRPKTTWYKLLTLSEILRPHQLTSQLKCNLKWHVDCRDLVPLH